MDLREAMKTRHMVRKYMDKPIPTDIVQKLNERVAENNEKYGVAVELRTNDSSAFNALIKMILAKGVQNFFVLGGKDTPELGENLGKCSADLMLYAQTLGLNTWWVGGTFNRGNLNETANGNKVIGVVAVGYGATQGVPHKSKSYKDVAVYEGDAPEWFKEGVEAALLAPTALNKQDFTVKGVGNKVTITANKESIFSSANIGLVKYHFELGAGEDNFYWDKEEWAMMNKDIEVLQSAITSANRIVAITGAGISMSAGIKDMEHLDFFSTIQMMSETILKTNPKHYYKIVRKVFLDATFINGPTVAHKKLAELERDGKLLGIVTTNIDCMHTVAGNKNVAEIQGSFGVNICLKCGKEYNDMNIWNKGICPKCRECGGVISAFPVHSHVGLYHPAVQQARQWLSNADLILVIASKGMYGGEYFSYINPRAKIIQINPKVTEFDRVASVNIHMKADDVFKQISCFERQA